MAHHAETAAVVEGDGGVEAAPAVELHVGTEPVNAGSGEMAAHAAREFLCLQTETHAHTDIMKNVVDEIAGVRLGLAPDWRTANVRKRIWNQVETSSVDTWRRLGGNENGSYGSSHRAAPRFDTEEFGKAFKVSIHHIPYVPWGNDDKTESLPWTCDPQEWQRWQVIASREQATASERPAPTSRAAKELDVLRTDPVVQKVISSTVSMETARQDPKTLTKEQADQLGPRAMVRQEQSIKGFKADLGQRGYSDDRPFYFDDPKECLERCTKGATYVVSYQGEKPALFCTNQECFALKVASGKQRFEKSWAGQVAVAEEEDQALATAIRNTLADTPQLGSLIAFVLLEELRIQPASPNNNGKGSEEFRYTPGTIQRVMEILDLKGPVDRWSLIDGAQAIKKASKLTDESAVSVGCELLAYATRTSHAPMTGLVKSILENSGTQG